ncbi:zonadhesin-like [Anomaloglossus baeobatrachus]|uniref:zonadhesin-like n=1 Tax=Anomaloglossus baeobatrachus TaxID=238106 RepID=UPI003F4FA2F1
MMSNGVMVSTLMLAFSAMFMEMLDARSLTLNCPENMVQDCSQCWGGTCQSLSSPITIKCSNPCIPGCICKRGYYLQNNECVPASQCNVQCPANMMYNPCGEKVVTCLTLNKPVQSTECKPRCECRDGYIFSGIKSQDCIEISQCSKVQNTN